MEAPSLRVSSRVVNEALTTVALSVYAACLALVAPPIPIPAFIERDPSLSYPFKKSTVPTSTLIALAICIPGGLMLLFITIASLRRKVSATRWFAAVAAHCVAIAQCLLFTQAITDTIKNVTAFPRPNFFAYCDYDGYREALSSGNFTDYLAATSPTAIGSVSHCRGPQHDVDDAQLSFPSGHASTSFAAMTLATLFLRHALSIRKGVHTSAQAIFAAAPLALAAWIAITRVRDRYHNTVDVLCGAVIGAIVAVLSWRHLEAHKRHELVPPLVTPSVAHEESGGDGEGVYALLCPRSSKAKPQEEYGASGSEIRV